jgi:uncharacterized protein (DUF1800 family)
VFHSLEKKSPWSSSPRWKPRNPNSWRQEPAAWASSEARVDEKAMRKRAAWGEGWARV